MPIADVGNFAGELENIVQCPICKSKIYILLNAESIRFVQRNIDSLVSMYYQWRCTSQKCEGSNTWQRSEPAMIQEGEFKRPTYAPECDDCKKIEDGFDCMNCSNHPSNQQT